MTTIEKAKNLAKDISAWVAAGAPMANSDASGKRLQICEACEHYENRMCKQCGCLMPAKVRLSTSKCPIGKW